MGRRKLMTKSTRKRIDIGDICVHCGRSTAYGHPDMLFVDRIPADADLLDHDGKPIGVREGYACRECIYVDEDDFFHEDNVSN
jgi:hypothetical protein